MPAKEEILLGKIALKLGVLSREQLDQCIREQEQTARQGAPVKPLGAILVQRQIIDTTQLDRLVVAQQQALQKEDEWLAVRKEDALFGKLVVKFGILAADKVNECLRVQSQMHDNNMDIRLGELMVKKGYLTPGQVADVLRLQQKVIMECVLCARAFNVPAWKRKEGFKCPNCGGELRLRAHAENIAVVGEVGLPRPGRDREGAAGDREDEAPAEPGEGEAPAEPVPRHDRKGALPPRQPVTGPDTPTLMDAAGPAAASKAPAMPSKETPFGRYLLLEELGRGGMGVVYKAWDTQLKRTVALKMMLEKEGDLDPALVKRFEREAQSVAKLRHPHIVQIYDVGVHDGSHYFTMDFLEGDDLKALLERGRSGAPAAIQNLKSKIQTALPLRKRLEILRDVALALEHAHGQGVIHRDLKPANIIVTPDRGAVVTDFGLARDVKQPGKSGLTLSGQVMGTPGYMSPEQAEGKVAKVGPQSDVYALGVILYEMATGRLPFVSDNIYELLRKVVQEEPKPPGKLAHKLRRDVETICLKALEKDPRRRYGSAAEFAADLARYLEGEPIAARALTTAERLWRRAVKNRAIVLPSAAAVLLGLVLLAWAVVGSSRRFRDIAAALEKASQAETAVRLASQESPSLENTCILARDAFQAVLTLDPENADAKNGLARVEARLKELAAARDAATRELEEEKQKAVAEAASAQLALDKAGRAQVVLSRWSALEEPLRNMEAAFYDSTMKPEDKRKVGDAHWPAVEKFIDDTPKDDTSQSTMFALSGWARRLAGYEEEGLQRMRKARLLDPDLPYGPLMEALAHFSIYLARQALPKILTGTSGVSLDSTPPEETADMRRIRMEMENLLTQAAEARVWGKGIAEDFRTAIGALQAMQAGRYEEAEKRLSAVAGTGAMNLFRTDIYFARAKLRYLCKRFREGRDDLANVVAARPMQAEPYYYLGDVKSAEATETASRGADPRQLLSEAVNDFTEALKRNPDLVEAHNDRGTTYQRLGEAELARGADPRPACEKAIADFDAALKRNPDDTLAYNNRGGSYAMLGEIELARGADPCPSCQKAIRDFTDALTRNPEYAGAYSNRGVAYRILGDAEVARGLDPRATYEKAIADCTEAVKRNPENALTYKNRGNAYWSLGEAEAARDADPRATYEKAIADSEEALKRNPKDAESYNNRATAYWSLGDARTTRGDDPKPCYEKALEDYGMALDRNPSLWQANINRAQLFEALGRYAQAVTEYETALKLVGDNYPPLKERLARAKEKAGGK